MIPNLMICILPAILVLIGIRKLRERSWGYCTNNIRLDNKIAIVTGANCGLGYEIAKELASRNAYVILACRSINAAEEAIDRIEKQLKKQAKMIALELDLSSLESIKKFALNVQRSYPKIHFLINNAGLSYRKDHKILYTKDNIEIHFGVNHLGHFYLTKLLLNTLKKSAPSRIIVVGSLLHEKGRIDFNETDATPKESGNLYANSKLANAYFCKELAKRTKDSGVNVYYVCPGWMKTSLGRSHSFKWYHYVLLSPIAFFYMRSPKQGAQTVIYCVTEQCLGKESGLMYRDCRLYNSKVKFEDDVSENLWELSERLIKAKINE